LKTVTLADIMGGVIDVEMLKNIPRGKTKLGQKAAVNILHYLIGRVEEDIPLVKKKVPTKKVPILDVPILDDDMITIENPTLPPKKSKKQEILLKKTLD
jgi:hypothetical protein